jgi:hypothetical protein
VAKAGVAFIESIAKIARKAATIAADFLLKVLDTAVIRYPFIDVPTWLAYGWG